MNMHAVPIALCVTALALSACRHPPASVTPRAGRYQGIGLYSPGDGWVRLADPGQPNADGKAKLVDDNQIIVVVDSQTGEVRQCGAISAYCVSFNPWTQGLGAGQRPPLALIPPKGEPKPALPSRPDRLYPVP